MAKFRLDKSPVIQTATLSVENFFSIQSRGVLFFGVFYKLPNVPIHESRSVKNDMDSNHY